MDLSRSATPTLVRWLAAARNKSPAIADGAQVSVQADQHLSTFGGPCGSRCFDLERRGFVNEGDQISLASALVELRWNGLKLY